MFLLVTLGCSVHSGYITDKMLWETTERCFKDHPQVEEEHVKHMKQQHTYVWKELYNCGKDVAEGITILFYTV